MKSVRLAERMANVLEKTRSTGSRSRFEREPGVRVLPGNRDERLLLDLFRFGAMSRSQIQALHFSSVSRCNMRLRQLFDGGFVRRHFLDLAPYGCQAVYTVGPSGVDLVAGATGWDLEEVRRRARGGSIQLLRHILSVVDIYLAVRAAVSNSTGVALERWLSEAEVRHEYQIRSPGGKWQTEVFRPDAFFRLEYPGGTYRDCFLEMDLGNSSSEQWKARIDRYVRYLESDLFEKRFGQPAFVVLVVTTGESRKEHLRQLVSDTHPEMFWYSTFNRVLGVGPLAPVWQTGAGTLRSLN